MSRYKIVKKLEYVVEQVRCGGAQQCYRHAQAHVQAQTQDKYKHKRKHQDKHEHKHNTSTSTSTSTSTYTQTEQQDKHIAHAPETQTHACNIHVIRCW